MGAIRPSHAWRSQGHPSSAGATPPLKPLVLLRTRQARQLSPSTITFVSSLRDFSGVAHPREGLQELSHPHHSSRLRRRGHPAILVLEGRNQPTTPPLLATDASDQLRERRGPSQCKLTRNVLRLLRHPCHPISLDQTCRLLAWSHAQAEVCKWILRLGASSARHSRSHEALQVPASNSLFRPPSHQNAHEQESTAVANVSKADAPQAVTDTKSRPCLLRDPIVPWG